MFMHHSVFLLVQSWRMTHMQQLLLPLFSPSTLTHQQKKLQSQPPYQKNKNIQPKTTFTLKNTQNIAFSKSPHRFIIYNKMEQDDILSDNKQQQHMFNVLTSNYLYPINNWQQEQLEPDLILVWKINTEPLIEKSKFMTLGQYIKSPSYYMRKAFDVAQKNIMREMAKNKQNDSQDVIKIRNFKSLSERRPKYKQNRFTDHEGDQFNFQVQCLHQKKKILDGFTLQYNSIVYTLQRVCGFKVRPFILYNQDLQDKKIFFFLNLSVENRLKLASKYQIKKQIDYSLIDLYLNDPTSYDGRPLKIHTDHQFNQALLILYKRISRYFGITDQHFGQTVINQIPFGFDEENRFLLETQDMIKIYQYFKMKNQPDLNKYQKQFIFQYNNKKINQGCKILYHVTQQRKQYFKMVQYLSDYYLFQSVRSPSMYKPFILPGKGYRGAGYFQRLKAILLYQPQIISEKGKLDLFLKMEKTKLAYVTLKQVFKIGCLEDMGFSFLNLPDKFELKGEGALYQDITGGINGKNVEQNWPMYTLFADTTVIRNYFGNNVGFQISFKLYMLYFFLTLVVVYFVIFIIDTVFGQNLFIIGNIVKLLLFVIAFNIYLTLWSEFEDTYITNFVDQVSSKVFLNSFRGPFVRNPLNDQVNEHEQEGDITSLFKNLICLIIIAAMLTLLGLLFWGFRLLLITFYNGMAGLTISFVSIPHLLAYFLFFLAVDLVNFLVLDKITFLLIKIKNPPTDESARLMAHRFKFIFILGIELIPPFFFLVLQPFMGTTCFARSCVQQLRFYVYSRYVIVLIYSIASTIILCYKRSKSSISSLLDESNMERTSFQSQMGNLLTQAVKELQKPQHQNTNSYNIIAIIGFSIYSVVLPLVVLITFANVLIDGYNVRSNLLNTERRTINKSQGILGRKEQLYFIYFLGVIINSWIIIYSFATLDRHFPGVIEALLTTVTGEGIFMLRILFIVILCSIMLFVGYIAGKVTQHVNNFWMHGRSKIKFQKYWAKGFTVKVKTKEPSNNRIIKTIFRTHNPNNMNHEMLHKMMCQVYKDVTNKALQNTMSLWGAMQPQSAKKLTQQQPQQNIYIEQIESGGSQENQQNPGTESQQSARSLSIPNSARNMKTPSKSRNKNP